jgi:hypothetical protein
MVGGGEAEQCCRLQCGGRPGDSPAQLLCSEPPPAAATPTSTPAAQPWRLAAPKRRLAPGGASGRPGACTQLLPAAPGRAPRSNASPSELSRPPPPRARTERRTSAEADTTTAARGAARRGAGAASLTPEKVWLSDCIACCGEYTRVGRVVKEAEKRFRGSQEESKCKSILDCQSPLGGGTPPSRPSSSAYLSA